MVQCKLDIIKLLKFTYLVVEYGRSFIGIGSTLNSTEAPRAQPMLES